MDDPVGPCVTFEDGPIVLARCPKCMRFINQTTIKTLHNSFTEEWRVSGVCKVCGNIEPAIIGYDGEFGPPVRADGSPR